MAETTFEQAKRCPKCDKPGEVAASTKAWSDNQNAEVEVKTIFCRTPMCPWENTSWIVQVNPDGSIPQPGSQLGMKKYPKLSPESETRVNEALQRQLWAETHPGQNEINNPYA